MKKLKNILAILSLSMALALQTGCSKEAVIDTAGSTKVPQGMVRLKLNTDGGEFQTPSTRVTANETALDDVWVLVFQGGDYEATFVEAVKSAGAAADRYVILTESAGDHKLLVVANADDFIVAKQSSLNVGSTTLTQAISTLGYGDPSNTPAGEGNLRYPHTYLPFTEPVANIPMSEVLSVSSIDGNTEINATGVVGGSSALELRRITAKVVVDGSAVYDKFKITQVAAFQVAARYGSLVPGDGGAIEEGVTFTDYYKGDHVTPSEICTDVITAGSAAQNNTENYPIYVYESKGASYIIIKATLNTEEGYYKLRLKKADGTDWDIKRNYKYIFKIKSVTNGGYPTLVDAISSTAVESNVSGEVVAVKEGNATDIVDNGTYYLATDCSEVVFYSPFTEANLYLQGRALVSVTTNAPAGTSNSITAVGSGTSTQFTVNESSLTPPAGSGTTVTTTNITLNVMNLGVELGVITIKVGNLTKTIKVTRHSLLGYGGLEEVGGNFTSGVVDPASTLSGFSLSTGGTKVGAGSHFVAATSAGTPVHLCADHGNLSFKTSPMMSETKSWGVAYLSRAGISGSTTPNRVKLLVRQNSLSMEPIKEMYLGGAIDAASGYWPYVGAFWKKNEVGERLIAMQNTTNSTWKATVMDGTDWIELDVNYNGTPPDNDHPSQAVSIGGGLTTVSGTGTAINFRIGLKSAYLPSAEHPARYGLVLVYYDGQSKGHPIFIRQGEAPAEVFPSSLVKWSPYNLTTPSFPNNNVSEGELLANNGGKEAFFPSQAGSLFQWNSLYAWHPTATVTWVEKSHIGTDWLTTAEPCPAGYKTPTKDQHIPVYAANRVWGYYADGYFDRRAIVASASAVINSAVSANSSTVAYNGHVFFNPATVASIFLPATGGRYFTTVGGAGIKLLDTGTNGFYWSSTASLGGNSEPFAYYRFFVDKGYPQSNDGTRNFSFSVRCVAE